MKIESPKFNQNISMNNQQESKAAEERIQQAALKIKQTAQKRKENEQSKLSNSQSNQNMQAQEFISEISELNHKVCQIGEIPLSNQNIPRSQESSNVISQSNEVSQNITLDQCQQPIIPNVLPDQSSVQSSILDSFIPLP